MREPWVTPSIKRRAGEPVIRATGALRSLSSRDENARVRYQIARHGTIFNAFAAGQPVQFRFDCALVEGRNVALDGRLPRNNGHEPVAHVVTACADPLATAARVSQS
jgi:hypothetical protein